MILAVDPGGTTGWCIYGPDLRGHGQGDDWLKLMTEFEEWISKGHIDTIVCESYVITSETVRKTRQYEPLMIIGTLFFLANKYEIEMTLQSRNIKAFATDFKLKNLGWYFKGNVHARDAARHLLAYLDDNQMIQPTEYMYG